MFKLSILTDSPLERWAIKKKQQNKNNKQLEKKKLGIKKFKVAPLVSRSLQALKERNLFPLAKVSLVDEKPSNEKGQSLQHLISKENHHKTFKEMKRKGKQEKLKQERLNQFWKKRIW